MPWLQHPLRHFRPELRNLPTHIGDQRVTWRTNYCTQGATMPFWAAMLATVAVMTVTVKTVIEAFDLGGGRSPDRVGVVAIIAVGIVFGVVTGVYGGRRLRTGREYYWGMRATLADGVHVHFSLMRFERSGQNWRDPGLKLEGKTSVGWTVTRPGPKGQRSEFYYEGNEFPAAVLEEWAFRQGMDPLQATLWANDAFDVFYSRYTRRVQRRFGPYPKVAGASPEAVPC